jgi:TolB-like protein/Tfp pilus assembly protein PilF
MIGTRLGHYRIVEKVGAGGMGEVYRAHDEQLDRDVALKVLPASAVEDDTARARLLREARAAAGLNHPNICTIHEVGESDGRAYIAMELVDGRMLSDVSRSGPVPIADVVQYGCQIAEALAHAHARQIVHRDLKCANVIALGDRRVKVLDFGLAKKVADQGLPDATTGQVRATLTEPGMLAGTLAYMAPEQLRGEPADARSDLWAAGVVLYELATGSLPFRARTAFELSSQILNEPLAAMPRSVPLALRAVVERCLEKQPSRRYQTAADLRRALDGVQSDAAPATVLRYTISRRPWLTTSLAVVVLAAIVGALNVERIRTRWFGGAPRVESLAVLPLENLTGDAAHDYFADGMTEILSTDLARLAVLKRVTARGSVSRYKGTTKPFADIARELNVDALVTGAVLRAGDPVVITAQLLDPATGHQLWTNTYERNLKDILALRNEIVSAIVGEVQARLSPSEAAHLTAARPVNPEAFEAYLKGIFHRLKQTREDFDLAERYFQSALDKDPSYALGYAGLASVWMMRGDAGMQPPSETFPKAIAFIDKALALDDDLADVHVLLGNIKSVTEWDWAASEREYKRALELNPNHADAHFFYSDLLLVLGRPDEWERESRRAQELDPLNDFNRSFYGWQLNYRHRYDEAIALFQKLLPTAPNKGSNYLGLWGAYYRKGDYAPAIAAAREYFNATGDKDLAQLLGPARDLTTYRDAMRRVGEAMVVRSKQRHVPGIRVARMFAHAGDTDRAIEWLETAYRNRESPLMRLGLVWDWDDLRADPRFQDLMRRIGLP